VLDETTTDAHEAALNPPRGGKEGGHKRPAKIYKLQGRLAGVQINQTTGKPGQGMSVRIRGQLSVSGGSDPLYVVDGFPITGDINQINPDEIQDISVLKDAASTSLYGSRAANGVVLITTKKGKAGRTDVNLNVYTGFQNVPVKGRLEMMNAEEFAQFKKEYYEDAKQTVPDVFQNPVIRVIDNPAQLVREGTLTLSIARYQLLLGSRELT